MNVMNTYYNLYIIMVCAMFECGTDGAQPVHGYVTSSVVHTGHFQTKKIRTRVHNGKLRVKRVVGGSPASLDAWPWIARLGYQDAEISDNDFWNCGGSLITDKHVLTAAHCVSNLPESIKLTKVCLGPFNQHPGVADEAKKFDVSIARIVSHAEYDASTYANDIALVILNETITFTEYVRPIDLPTMMHDWTDVDLDGTELHVAGWGRTSNKFSTRSTSLIEAKVPISSFDRCRSAYANTPFVIDDRVICAGTRGRDACTGDSGGPLVFRKYERYHLIGIVSFGNVECGKIGYPGVYTKVKSFMDWILREI